MNPTLTLVPIRSVLLAAIGLAFFVSPSAAVDILYRSTGSLDFSGDPIPADFFGPGSLPFEGTVSLTGVPIGPAGTDTIVERGPVMGGVETVPIEIVAMELRSIAPIEVDFGTGTSFFDVFVHLDPSPPSTGQMQLQQTSPSGGTIGGSFFDVFTTIELGPVVPGPSLTLPHNETLFISLPPVQFIYVPPINYPGPPGFYPDPQTFDGEGPLFITLVPSPEPSSVVLAGCGLAVLVLIGRRLRRPLSP
jgi:hypothetical protein